MTSEQDGSGPADLPSARRFARIPVWGRIGVVLAILVVVAGIIAVVVAMVVATRADDDPKTVLQAMCASAVEDHLERRGSDDIEVSAAAMQVSAAGDAYRVQGTASFTQDGLADQANVRCTVRDENGTWRVAAVRVSG